MRSSVRWLAVVVVLASYGPASADPAWESVEVTRGWATDSGSLTLDDGRPRLALRRPADQGGGGLAYVACDADCTDPEGWTVTELPAHGTVIPDLAVDDRGRPRIGFRSDGDVRYAACDDDCTDPDQWALTTLVEAGDASASEVVAFALDGRGRPRMAYTDAGDWLRYLWCDADCTRTSGWNGVTVPDAGGVTSVAGLAFDGVRPWIAYVRRDGGEYDVRFAVCGDDCDDRARWVGAAVHRSSTALRAPSLHLTAEGEPRFSYTWGDRLVYRACDQDCDTPSGWEPPVTIERGPVDPPVLVLDADDRPRIAYIRDGVPRLAWCDQTCTSDEGWSRQTLEVVSDAARPSLAADDEQLHLAVTDTTDSEEPRVHYARCADACGQLGPPSTGRSASTSGSHPDPSAGPSSSPSPTLATAGSGPSPSPGSTDRADGSPAGPLPVPGDRPTRRGPAGETETPTPSHEPGSSGPQPSAVSRAAGPGDRGGSAWIVVVGGLAAAAVIGTRRMGH